MTENELNKKTCKVMKSKESFKNEMARSFSSSDVEKIWTDAEVRLFEMYAAHTDLPKDVSAHTDNFIFPAAAIYLAMKQVDEKAAYEIMKKVMAEKSDKMGRMLSKCCHIPGFKKFFLGILPGFLRIVL